MLWEARYVAEIHIADELTNAFENSTLYSDGTSNKVYIHCNVHTLAGQAEESIKLWGRLLIGDAKVVSFNHCCYLKGESGTLYLIHAICK